MSPPSPQNESYPSLTGKVAPEAERAIHQAYAGLYTLRRQIEFLTVRLTRLKSSMSLDAIRQALQVNSPGDSLNVTGMLGLLGEPQDPNYDLVILETKGNLSTGVDLWTHREALDYSIPQSISVRVKSAPTGADLIINLKKNGTESLFSGGSFSLLAGSPNTRSSTTFNPQVSLRKGDYITGDVVQVGSVTPGADLMILLKLKLLDVTKD
jgi:hypothetical protein